MRKGKKQGILNKRDCKEQRFGASWLLPVCIYIIATSSSSLFQSVLNAAEEVILSTFSSAEEHSIGRWTCVAGVF